MQYLLGFAFLRKTRTNHGEAAQLVLSCFCFFMMGLSGCHMLLSGRSGVSDFRFVNSQRRGLR